MAQTLAQPNYQRLADAFSAAGEECSRLPNILAINDSQTLVDLIGWLRDDIRLSATQTTARFNTLQTDMITLQNDMTTLRATVTVVQTNLATIQTDVSALHTRLDVSETNVTARLYNSTINNAQTLLQPLRDRHNMPVQSFPENGEALSKLSHEEYNSQFRIQVTMI